MIRGKLKKYALEHDLRLDAGVAYGALNGYAVTLSRDSGFVQLFVATGFAAESKYQAFRTAAEQQDVQKKYQVQKMQFVPEGINVLFPDNPGVTGQVAQFAEWFLPLLDSYGASKADICLGCGRPVENGTWILRDDVAAFCMHEECAQKAVEAALEQTLQGKEKKSCLKGFLGALVGMLAGSVLWAALYALNIVAAAAGFVMGWLANTLYDRFGGKRGKGKVAILITVMILGVLLGTFLGMSVSMAIPILRGEWTAYWSLQDIPSMVLVRVLSDSNIRLLVLRDVALGLVFAALGVYTLLRSVARQVTGKKVTLLK